MPTVPTQSLNPIAANQFAAPTVDPLRDVVSPQIEALGAATERVGASVLSMAEQIQDAHNEAMAREQDNLYTREVHQALYDPQNGFMALRQKNAVEASQALRDKITQARAQAEGRLGNRMQREMFGRASQGRLQAALGEIDGHTMTQLRAWNIGEAKAGVEAQREAAVLAARGWAFDAPRKRFMEQVDGFKARLADLARLEGVDEKQAKEIERQQVSSLHEAVIYNFLNTTNRADGNPRVALDYLKQHRDEIDSERRDNVTNAVLDAQEQEDVVYTSKLIADEAMQKNPRNWGAQKKALQTWFDSNQGEGGERGPFATRVYDAALRRLEAIHDGMRAGADRAMTRARGHFNQYMMDNHRDAREKGVPLKTIEDYQREHPKTYALLGPEGAQQPDMIRFSTSGRFLTTPDGMKQAATITDEQLRGMTADRLFNEYRYKLDDRDYERLEARRARANSEPRTEKQTWLTTVEDDKDFVFRRAMGVKDGAKLTNEQLMQRAQFEQYANRVLQDWQDRPGDPADRKQVQALLDRVALQMATTQVGFPDPTLPVWAMSPEQREEAFVKMPDGEDFQLNQIPPQEFEEITTALIRAGIPPTTQAVVQAFRKAR